MRATAHQKTPEDARRLSEILRKPVQTVRRSAWSVQRGNVYRMVEVEERFTYERGVLTEYRRFDPDLGGPGRGWNPKHENLLPLDEWERSR
jgi:hypothetical protein